MRRFLCIVLTVTMLLGCTSFEFVSAAATGLQTTDGFLDVEAEDLEFDKEYLEVKEGDLYSNSKGLAVLSEDKTEPATDDPGAP